MSLLRKYGNSSRLSIRARRRLVSRRSFFEPLERRDLLSSVPIAVEDRVYFTAAGTALTLTTSNDLMENDWDPDGNTLTASKVTDPTNGSISGFNASTGVFTYTPNAGFTGVDSFTYKVNDGALDSNIATVLISVGKPIGGRTNLEEMPRGDRQQMTGSLELAQELLPGLNLIYQSDRVRSAPYPKNAANNVKC